MSIPKEKLNEVAARLEGTCNSLDEVFEEVTGVHIEDASPEALEWLDSQVMLCDCCGWWVEASEIDDDGNCTDCAES